MTLGLPLTLNTLLFDNMSRENVDATKLISALTVQILTISWKIKCIRLKFENS